MTAADEFTERPLDRYDSSGDMFAWKALGDFVALKPAASSAPRVARGAVFDEVEVQLTANNASMTIRLGHGDAHFAVVVEVGSGFSVTHGEGDTAREGSSPSKRQSRSTRRSTRQSKRKGRSGSEGESESTRRERTGGQSQMVAARFTTGLASGGHFYTDSNGMGT
jgi:hypothetical protein